MKRQWPLKKYKQMVMILQLTKIKKFGAFSQGAHNKVSKNNSLIYIIYKTQLISSYKTVTLLSLKPKSSLTSNKVKLDFYMKVLVNIRAWSICMRDIY